MGHLISMKKLLSEGDTVVFYGDIDSKIRQQIKQQLPDHQHFVVYSENSPHIRADNECNDMRQLISHHQWANLIIKYQRIFAWK